MIGRYWWSQQDKTNKIHWIGWPKLTRSKKLGGLGVTPRVTETIIK
jgi:hypothetical protein